MILNDKTCVTFDVEVLVNCFTCTFYNTETKNIRTFEVSERKNEITDLIKIFQNKDVYFIGYNNIHYDNPIINYCIEFFNNNRYDYKTITKSLYNLSQCIISKEDTQQLWSRWKFANNFHTIDLLTMYFSKALRVSLKEIQVTMMYKNVQEMNHDWDKPILSSFIDDLINYNINDVLSTAELLKMSENDLKLRLDIYKQYNVNVLSKDGMKIGITILEEMYCKYSGVDKYSLKDMRSYRPIIDLGECVLPFIEFNSAPLQRLLRIIKNKKITGTKNVLKLDVLYDDMIYTVATGGLHSQNKPEIIEPKEDELLIDADVGSYYPSMMIHHNFVPEHLGDSFLKVYTQIYHDRLKAKKEGNKTVAETLKLSLNGKHSCRFKIPEYR